MVQIPSKLITQLSKSFKSQFKRTLTITVVMPITYLKAVSITFSFNTIPPQKEKFEFNSQLTQLYLNPYLSLAQLRPRLFDCSNHAKQ